MWSQHVRPPWDGHARAHHKMAAPRTPWDGRTCQTLVVVFWRQYCWQNGLWSLAEGKRPTVSMQRLCRGLKQGLECRELLRAHPYHTWKATTHIHSAPTARPRCQYCISISLRCRSYQLQKWFEFHNFGRVTHHIIKIKWTLFYPFYGKRENDIWIL